MKTYRDWAIDIIRKVGIKGTEKLIIELQKQIDWRVKSGLDKLK